MTTRCNGITKQGKPCKATSQSTSTFCFFHDPEKEGERAEARKQGGRTRKYIDISELPKGKALSDADNILASLEKTWKATTLLDNSVSRTRALDSLLRTAIKVFEVAELQRTIKRLENIMIEKGLMK